MKTARATQFPSLTIVLESSRLKAAVRFCDVSPERFALNILMASVENIEPNYCRRHAKRLASPGKRSNA